MASIWNDIEIDFKGKTYTVRPSLQFINRIEQGPGNSITQLYHRLTQGDLPTGKAVELIHAVIVEADPDTKHTIEDVFEETGGIGVGIMSSVQTILLACLPTPKETAATRQAKKKSSKKAPASKKPTGRSSTG